MDPDQVPNTYLSYGPNCTTTEAYDFRTCVSSRTSLTFDNSVPEGFASVEFFNGTHRVLAFGDVITASSDDVMSHPITLELAGLLPDQSNPDNWILDAYGWSKATSLLHLTGSVAADTNLMATRYVAASVTVFLLHCTTELQACDIIWTGCPFVSTAFVSCPVTWHQPPSSL